MRPCGDPARPPGPCRRRSAAGDRATPSSGDGAHRARCQHAERELYDGRAAHAVTVAARRSCVRRPLSRMSRAPSTRPEIIEYWKSAPYLLNFMRDYGLKRLLEGDGQSPSAALRDAIARRPASDARSLRPRRAMRRSSPANGRMRAIMDDIFGAGLDSISASRSHALDYGAKRSAAIFCTPTDSVLLLPITTSTGRTMLPTGRETPR